MYNKNHDCVYVTKSILEMYIPHCKQTGNLHFETLGDLSDAIRTELNSNCSVTPILIGLDGLSDSDERIIKKGKPWRSHKTVKVPLSNFQLTMDDIHSI